MIVFDPLKMTGVWQRYFLLMILLVIAWSEAKDICWWWWFSWWLLQVRPRGQCLLPNLGRLRFKPIRLQSPVKLHFAQYQRKMLKIFWTHDFNTWKQEKEGKCLQIHWGIERKSCPSKLNQLLLWFWFSDLFQVSAFQSSTQKWRRTELRRFKTFFRFLDPLPFIISYTRIIVILLKI